MIVASYTDDVGRSDDDNDNNDDDDNEGEHDGGFSGDGMQAKLIYNGKSNLNQSENTELNEVNISLFIVNIHAFFIIIIGYQGTMLPVSVSTITTIRRGRDCSDFAFGEKCNEVSVTVQSYNLIQLDCFEVNCNWFIVLVQRWFVWDQLNVKHLV